VRVLIFDLDGTLIDSKLDLALAVNAALEEMGRGPLAHEQIFSYVGQGAPSLIARALGDGAPKRIVCAAWNFSSSIILFTSSTTPSCIRGSRGPWRAEQECPWRCSLTSRGRQCGILKGLGLADHFRFVYGGNSFERKKPDPMGVETILREFGAAPAQSMVVVIPKSMCRRRAMRALGLRRNIRFRQPSPGRISTRYFG